MELNVVQTPLAPGALKANSKHRRVVPRRRFKQHRGHQHGGGSQQQQKGGSWRGGVRASEVVGPMPVKKVAAAGAGGEGGQRDGQRSRPPHQQQQGAVMKRPFAPGSKRPPPPPQQQQKQEAAAAAAGRKRARVAEAGEASKRREEEEEEEEEEEDSDSAPSSVAAEEEGEEDGMEVEGDEEESGSEEDGEGEQGDGDSSDEEEEEEAVAKPAAAKATVSPPPPARKQQQAAAAPADGGSKPSRKHPLPATTAALDAYHIKPAELDRVVKVAAAAAAAAPEKEVGAGAVGKSSKHIFTATPFAALGLHERLVGLLSTPREHHGFGLKVATKVQSAAIPALLRGDNALLCSETGSGKTLAYLLPLLQQLQALQPRPTRGDGTFALVVAPTRELCHQIHDVLAKLVRAFIWVVPGLVSGGERRKSEKARLRKGVTILVGTPGRLLDHLQNTQALKRDRARWLVLDEVDRLVDLGFEAQVREIVARLKDGAADKGKGLQVMAATATLAGAIDRFGRELLGDHVRIDAKTGTVRRVSPSSSSGSAGADADAAAAEGKEGAAEEGAEAAGEAFTTPVQLVQQYMLVTCKLRLPALCAFLRVHAGAHKTVVFFSTCDSVDFHHQLLRSCAWPGEEPNTTATAASDSEEEKKAPAPAAGLLLGAGLPVHRLHGNIPQAERLQTFRAFSTARQGVLLCTDVAARGLDLPSVDWIVQYDPPTETAEYVHRVGRTARRGRKGRALLFLLPAEKGYLDVLQRKGIAAPSPLSLQQTLFKATPKRFLGRFRAPEEVFCLELQQRMERAVAADKELLARGRKAFGSFVRAYATHPAELKPIFAVRALHLGHVAKSFALKEPPTALKVGKEVVKIPGAGKSKEEKNDEGSGGGGGDGAGKKKKKVMAAGDFSPPRSAAQQQGKKGGKPRTQNALNSLSEFSAG